MNSNCEIKPEVHLEMTPENQKLYNIEVKRVYDMVWDYMCRSDFRAEYTKTVKQIIKNSGDEPKNNYIRKNISNSRYKIYKNKNKYQVYQTGFIQFDLNNLEYMSEVCGEELGDVVNIKDMPVSVTMASLVECMVNIMFENDTDWCEIDF